MHFLAGAIDRLFPARASMSSTLSWLAEQECSIATVVDVGASDGRWSKRCMKSFPDANYVLFEPNPVHSGSLSQLEASDNKVRVVRSAAAEAEGQISFNATDRFGGAISRDPKLSGDEIIVPVTTLDNELAKEAGGFLVKLDTHGFEKAILEGAKETLERANVLIIEAYNFRITDEAMMFWELCAYLVERGFVVADLVDVMYRPLDGAFWQCDLVFLKDTWKNANVNNFAS